MLWITREKVKVDRVACPWLIKKFVDPEAEFYFVPPDQMMNEAKRLGAIPFELGHHGKECSFEAILWIVYDALYAYCKRMIEIGKPNGGFIR